MARVVHFSSVHRALDSRIHHRECRSLAEAGHDVTVIVAADSGEQDEMIHIRCVPPPRGRADRMSRIAAALFRAVCREAPEICHFHDPELIPVGILLKACGHTVVYDVHEDVPKQMRSKEWLRFEALQLAAVAGMKPVELAAGRLLDAVVVAAPEIGERFPNGKTVVVRNFVRVEDIDRASAADRSSAKAVAIYPGTLSETRGVREIVAAMDYLDGDVELWLLGPWSDSRLEAACRRLPGWEHTRYLGRVRPREVYPWMKAADIGLHMPYRVANYTSGLAVKGFEYMACGLPIVMTDEPGKRRTFGECALFADDRDPASIAERIMDILEDPGLAANLGRRGRELVEERYSWGGEAEKLLRLYERLSPAG